MKTLMHILFLCIMGFSIASSTASLSIENLETQCWSANPKSISKFCTQYLQQEVNKRTLNEFRLEMLLNDKVLAKICYLSIFCDRICPKSQYTIQALKDKDFVKFLLTNDDILKGLAFSGKGNFMTLDFIHQIWKLENQTLDGSNLKMALGAALSLSSEEQIEDRMVRYRFYQQSHLKGELFSQFETLHPWEMSILFSSGRNVDELSWAQMHTANKKNYTDRNAGDIACSFIPYRMKNKDGVSIHEGNKFYDFKPQTLPILVEYGGVCGAVSTSACGFIGAKGIPAYTVSQPGHCAFVWKSTDGNWKIGNNIYGWIWTGNRNLSPWPGHPYMISVVSKFQSHSQFEQSWLCYELSKYARNEQDKKFLLDCAVKTTKWNLPAWEDSLRLISKKLGKKEKIALIDDIAKSFRDEPIIMRKLVNDGLGIQQGKYDALQLAALMLDSSTSRDASEMYMLTLAEEAKKAIPSLAGKLEYNVKTRKNYFKKWSENTQDNKFSGSSKNRYVTSWKKLFQIYKKTRL